MAEVRSVDLLAVRGAETAARADPVAVEEPLEIRAEAPGEAANCSARRRKTDHSIGWLGAFAAIGRREELPIGELLVVPIFDELVVEPPEIPRPIVIGSSRARSGQAQQGEDLIHQDV